MRSSSPVHRKFDLQFVFERRCALKRGTTFQPHGWTTRSVGRTFRKSVALRVMMPWKRSANAAIKTSATGRFTLWCCLRLNCYWCQRRWAKIVSSWLQNSDVPMRDDFKNASAAASSPAQQRHGARCPCHADQNPRYSIIIPALIAQSRPVLIAPRQGNLLGGKR